MDIIEIMLDISVLIILVGLDLTINLIRWWVDLNKPEPLSSHEFHFFRYDLIDLLEKLVNEDSKETRHQILEARLDVLKAIKKLKDDPKNKEDSG